jgi:hypothetical protein
MESSQENKSAAYGNRITRQSNEPASKKTRDSQNEMSHYARPFRGKRAEQAFQAAVPMKKPAVATEVSRTYLINAAPVTEACA